ncbi:hypothetical protein SARC_17950 [Sphaeroforma arctica JP610]|uniref:Uncharacterized protein n=1 Tax=Sphaeroforma arctica JP610 TaxID=667725 RepID=A0A0L0F069_9EUKA|nr:hypothetical protein SARC_17950 [Sphaeroforma arctica JP610]KNC69538.1 hypothetical protein SARC_17950 [Sphaeroforma arctica JP610]|eukprot:XP_014143440.1 hypothetical protein SARC_17950 [Sphaeroforma arctica JP610]
MAYEMELGDADSLVMHLPLDGNPLRPAYTHKLSGMHARGTLEIDDETYMFPDAAAALDWTKSLSLRRTGMVYVCFPVVCHLACELMDVSGLGCYFSECAGLV